MSCEVEMFIESGLEELVYECRDGFITAVWRPSSENTKGNGEMSGKMSGKMSGTVGGDSQRSTPSICDIGGASPPVAALANLGPMFATCLIC